MLSRFEPKIKNERQLKAIAGVTESQLELIAKEFRYLEDEKRKIKYEQAVLAGERIRKPGGGNKGILQTPIQKVLFVLLYGKTYPTFDDLGNRFGMSKSAAYDNICADFPLVQKALACMGVLPHRTFRNINELLWFC